jgi:excisionase family DNA binding protein
MTGLLTGLEEQIRAIGEQVNELREDLRAGSSPYLNVEQAASYIAAPKQRIYDLLSAGRIPKHKDGRRVLIRRDHLDAYLEGRPIEEPKIREESKGARADTPEVSALLEEILHHPTRDEAAAQGQGADRDRGILDSESLGS